MVLTTPGAAGPLTSRVSGQAGFAGDGADPRLPGQQACHVAGGPVIEVIDLDRGSFT
jgi:hypothetical protein